MYRTKTDTLMAAYRIKTGWNELDPVTRHIFSGTQTIWMFKYQFNDPA